MFVFYPTKIQVIVHLKNNKSIRGFIWKHNSQYLELKQAELLQSTDSTIPMDGEILIYRPDVDFIQIL